MSDPGTIVPPSEIAAEDARAALERERRAVRELAAEVERLRAENTELRGAAERQRIESTERAERLADRARELERFAHVAAHDLKAPLRAINGFSEAAARNLDDPERARALLARVEGASRRLGELVSSVLRFASIGQSALRPAATALGDLVEQLVLDMQPELDAVGAEVRYQGLPALSVDPTLMRQVFQNLLANALKFRDPSRPLQVTVGAKPVDDGWRISFADNGVGFDPADADLIFDAFRRLHSTREYPGSGVGLSICRRIIERHQGTIWATARSGEGATIHFTLPGGSASA